MSTDERALREAIESILNNADLSWFTSLLSGEQWRYVVGLTHNLSWSIDLLVAQARFASVIFESITIGWRTSPTGAVLIDVGTMVNDLKQALSIGRTYRQQCIRDTVEEKEIAV